MGSGSNTNTFVQRFKVDIFLHAYIKRRTLSRLYNDAVEQRKRQGNRALYGLRLDQFFLADIKNYLHPMTSEKVRIIFDFVVTFTVDLFGFFLFF